MLKSMFVAVLLISLGLFAPSGIARTEPGAVYAAADYSALAQPGVAIANAETQAILTSIEQSMIAATSAGGIPALTPAIYDHTVVVRQRLDFL